ncbi:MAG: RNA chaperone Hfq [Candidatus Wallbacteria bacterium HGW-Wallbacteria-1]|jgi:host factor-I protein|uniref:RNA-binding protein Hfq n=1 Tax=Candidatus Wallbacteria bacterium HGW-Wallbacteria-1 TaxID=2013854 RepID=A0A2N1PQ87_9BACT|nr:MAG: RNA chaperone Hfq [Candidatus Wallbacteria bacterium HGW-Wallbacteria-1]
MPKKIYNLQDSFLNQLRKEEVEVQTFLTNGVRIKGRIKGFDNFTVLMISGGKQHLVFKHAISTVIPSKSIHNIFQGEDDMDMDMDMDMED